MTRRRPIVSRRSADDNDDGEADDDFRRREAWSDKREAERELARLVQSETNGRSKAHRGPQMTTQKVFVARVEQLISRERQGEWITYDEIAVLVEDIYNHGYRDGRRGGVNDTDCDDMDRILGSNKPGHQNRNDRR